MPGRDSPGWARSIRPWESASAVIPPPTNARLTVEDLEAFGLVPMDAEEIRWFLAADSVGVLGLPGEDPPILRPMSYGYDRTSLYLRFVFGADSEKRRGSEGAGQRSGRQRGDGVHLAERRAVRLARGGVRARPRPGR